MLGIAIDDGKRSTAQLQANRAIALRNLAYRLWLLLQISPSTVLGENHASDTYAGYLDVRRQIALALATPPIVETFLSERVGHDGLRTLDAHTPIHRQMAATLRKRYGTLTVYASLTMRGSVPRHTANVRTWGDGEITWHTAQSAQFGLGWTAALSAIPPDWSFYDLMLAMRIV